MYPFPARTVGADNIRPQHKDFSKHPVKRTRPLGVDILVDPYRGRFVLRADAIRPDGAGLYFSANCMLLPAQ